MTADPIRDSLIQQRDKHESGWSHGYQALPRLISQHGLTRGVEVGVAFGGHSQAMLAACPQLRLTGVDAYRHYPDYDDPMNLPQPVFDRLHDMTCERLAGFGDRFSMIRDASTDAATRFDDGSLDFVYLDADHSEAGVWTDLYTWAIKVRVGGIISGHDYGHPDFAGVKRAVDRYFGRFGWAVHEEGHGVWWVQREHLPISFFTPCYNCAEHVRETAATVIDGNLQAGDEYILVNDGSSDDTGKVLDTISAVSDAVRVIHHPQNRGGSAARNTAARAAKHRLLFCLDSDNQLPPGSVAELRDHLLRAGTDTVGFQTLKYFSDQAGPGHVTHELSYEPVITDFARSIRTTRVPAGSGNYLFTRDAWERAGGYPEGAGALDAWGFGLRKAATGSTATVLPGSFYYHRHEHDSYWVRHARQGTIDKSALQVLKPFLHMIDPRDVRYLLGEKSGARWFTDLDRRPLRPLMTNTSNHALPVPVVCAGILGRLRRLVGRAA